MEKTIADAIKVLTRWGFDNADIAEMLNFSENTIRRIKEKHKIGESS